MARLERNSPGSDRPVRTAPAGRLNHHPGEVLKRHRHEHGFATVVLSGRYVEAGDTGRHSVEPGDVILHAPHESHVNRIGASGAQVLVVPLSHARHGMVHGYCLEPDTIVRLAEQSIDLAAAEVHTSFRIKPRAEQDWPAMLAEAITETPDLSLREWAQAHGLHHGSLSRGFRQEFSVSPARFRLIARMHKAMRLLDEQVGLAQAAHGAGFADQSHLTRTLRDELGQTPLQFFYTLAHTGEL